MKKMQIFMLMKAMLFILSSATHTNAMRLGQEGKPNLDLLKQKLVFGKKTKFSQRVLQDPQASLQWMAQEVRTNARTETERRVKERVQKYGLIGQCIAQVGLAGFDQLQVQHRGQLIKVMAYKDFQFIYWDGALKDPLLPKQLTQLLKYNIRIQSDLYHRLTAESIGRHVIRQVGWYQQFDDQVAAIIKRDKPQELNQLINTFGRDLFCGKQLQTKKVKEDVVNFAMRHIDQIAPHTVQSLMFSPEFRTRYANHLIQGDGVVAPGGAPALSLSRADPQVVERLTRWLSTTGPAKSAEQFASYCVQHFDQFPPEIQQCIISEKYFAQRYAKSKIAQNNPSFLNDRMVLCAVLNQYDEKWQEKIVNFCIKHKDVMTPEALNILREKSRAFKEFEQKIV